MITKAPSFLLDATLYEHFLFSPKLNSPNKNLLTRFSSPTLLKTVEGLGKSSLTQLRELFLSPLF